VPSESWYWPRESRVMLFPNVGTVPEDRAVFLLKVGIVPEESRVMLFPNVGTLPEDGWVIFLF